MRIGLFFGSFNPIHIGHLIVAGHVHGHCGLDSVWFVVSPQNPLKPSSTLLNEYDRLNLVQRAIGDDPRFRASNAEFKLPRPSYTIDTLTYLSEQHPGHAFSVIMGSDSYQNLGRWKNGALLQRDYPIIVYRRPGFEAQPGAERVTVLDAPMLEISATYIRGELRAGRTVRYLVPDAVAEQIDASGHYR